MNMTSLSNVTERVSLRAHQLAAMGQLLDYLEAWLAAQDVGEAVERLAGRPLLLMHAEGDTQIPSEHSEELYERAGEPRELMIIPGGAHTTVQHDPELQSTALRWLERRLG